MWILLLFLINIIQTDNQEFLKFEKLNTLKDNIQYKCKLQISDISKLKKEINYIVFDFPKEKKNKRNEVYISSKENEATNSYSIFKLPLFGSNKIIIPYEYAKSEEYLFINIICYKKEKCNEEIIINAYNKLTIKEGETIYINGYKENYFYYFDYNYKDNNIKENIFKQLAVYSYQKNDFEFNLNKNKEIIKNESLEHILNGYFYNIRKEELKDCSKYCDFELKIKIKKSSSYIMVQIISFDNDKEYSDIDLIRPIVGILDNENEKKCFNINEKNDDQYYFIDFMIEEESLALIFENDNELKNILFSQTIKLKSSDRKFCLKKLYPNINSVSFSFTIYIPDNNDYFINTDYLSVIRNKSFLGLLYNGYYYRKIIMENESKNAYFPSEYNGNILYFYLYIIRGIIDVSNYITNNFPFTKNENENKENFKLLNINNIGNEYFGTILIKDQININSSPINANKNIFLVKCVSGVSFNDEKSSFCEFNIMFYTENDLIHLRKNDKFSYLNYDKIKLKIEVSQNTKYNKLIIDLYTHFGFSYINFLNNKDSTLNTFYNGNLISNEITFHTDKKNTDDIVNCYFEIISYDCDYVSIVNTGDINDNDNEILKTYFWFNDYILTTLTKRVSKKKIIIDHIPNVATDLNFFKTIIFLRILNCEIHTNILENLIKSKYLTSGFHDIIDNNHLIYFETSLSDVNNRIEFEIDLIKTHDDEPVCMIYFSSFLIEDMDHSVIYPILIRENIDTPIILTSKLSYVMNLEYIILKYNSPLIISISFEQVTAISLSYRINNKKINKDLYYSQNIIIYENEIKKLCNQDQKQEEQKILCKLNILISKKSDNIYDSKYPVKKILININIKSNYEKHMTYLNKNTLTDGIILGDQFQYYYTNIRQNDSGSIVLNNKKGIGLMYARIINKNTFDEKGKDWNGRIQLLKRENLENCKDCLIYDFNSNEIIFSEKETKNCNSDLRCQIIIGISNIENKDEDNANENDIYEYSIYLLKNNKKKNIFGNIKIQSNKYIQANLFNNINNKIIYDYYLPSDVEDIKYELQCINCKLNLITNGSKINQDNEDKSIIEKYGSKIIKFENEIQLYYNKIISFEISLNKNEENKNDAYQTIYFKISLLYKGMNESITFLDSEMNTLCYNECFYLIPINDYDKLTSLTMSISDEELKAKLNTELEFTIYDSNDYYGYIIIKDNEYIQNPKLIKSLPEISKLSSKKNYIIYESNVQYKDMIIIGHIKIFSDLINEKYKPFQVFFTYSKNSRKNYFLYPNRNNLLFINKNSEYKNIKEIRIPNYYLIKNNQENHPKNSSIITFSHIKGEGVIELITNNYYLHNNQNKLYTELKTFIFDNSHSFFQINYNYNSKFTKKFFINSFQGLYTYSSISTNLYPNANEIKLGKTNNILHQYDSLSIYLYIKINDITEIENDLTIDIKIEGLDIYKNYNISFTGYYSYSNNLNIDFNNNKKFPISKGFYDNITNIGIIKFKSKSMKMYYKNNNINLIVLYIQDMNYNKEQSIDIIIKATPIKDNFLLNLTNNYKEINDISIPQFEYYFSYIDLSINNYMIYKLKNFREEDRYISIEFIFLYNTTEFSLHIDKYNLFPDKPNFYLNETIIKFIDERNQNGKRSIIIEIGKEIKEIYLIIFMKNKTQNMNNKISFSLKYYSFKENDYLQGKYLYKNRFSINTTEIKITKEYNNKYYLNWDKIELLQKNEQKGEIKIDYYFKIINKSNLNNIDFNNGIFNNYIFDKCSYGIHLINKNRIEINQSLNNENLEIYLIAKFNEINGMENLFIYNSLVLNNVNENNNINNENINKNNGNVKNEDKIIYDKYIIYKKIAKAFIFLLIIILVILIILFSYKLIRKIQIKSVYNKFIKENNSKIALFNEDINDKSFESKISFLIET